MYHLPAGQGQEVWNPLAVVEGFDEIEDLPASVIAVANFPVQQEFLLKRGVEALRHSVVPAVAASTHAGRDAVDFEESSVGGARVLASLVAVMNPDLLTQVGESTGKGGDLALG